MGKKCYLLTMLFFIMLLLVSGCSSNSSNIGEDISQDKRELENMNQKKVTNDQGENSELNNNKELDEYHESTTDNNSPKELKSTLYNKILVDEVPKSIKNWLDNLVRNQNWLNDSLIHEGKTYLLVKSSSSKNDGVEIDQVLINDQSLYFLYKTFDYHEPSEDLIDFLLYQVEGEFSVEFLITVSTDR